MAQFIERALKWVLATHQPIYLKREIGITILGMAMELIRTFEKLGKQDVALAGGKGASLGEMTQAGVPILSGFVVLSNAFLALFLGGKAQV